MTYEREKPNDIPCKYRAAAIIDLDHIAYNIKSIRKSVSANTEIMAVIKADGYGHGGLAVARTAIQNGIGHFGVAIAEEGEALRKGGIDGEILVMGHTPSELFKCCLQNDLTITIFDYDSAQSLSLLCGELGSHAKIHIKIDTGMGRIGLYPDGQGLELIKKIYSLPNIAVKGIYTHLAQSDTSDESYSSYQYNLFAGFLERLKEAGVSIPCVHISNSGAIALLRKFDLNIVRAGIILYGLKPSCDHAFDGLDIKPALSFKSYVSFIKQVEPGESIGYGRTYFTKNKTTVATIPLGYADGYSRLLSNRGRVLINGEFAPIIGNICMDQFMVDITGIADVQVGDEVVLIGTQKDKTITADEIACLQNTISYEVVCGLSKRVKRIYRYTD